MIQTEKHEAVVADNADPENRLRIKVRCAGLLGSEGAVFQRWCEPCLDWGFVVVPDVGEQVEIEVTATSSLDESPGQAFLEAPNVRYRGKRFYGPDTPISAFFTEANYGKRRGYATPGGHVLMFDDTDGARKINLAWYSGTGNEYSMVSVDESGSIIASTKDGSMLYLNVKNGEASLIAKDGTMLSFNSDGFNLIDKNSNIVKSKGNDVQVLAQNSLTVSGKNVLLDAGKTQVGSQTAAEGVVKGTTYLTGENVFLAALNTFIGTIAPPPSGLAAFQAAITAFQAVVAAAASTKHFTE